MAVCLSLNNILLILNIFNTNIFFCHGILEYVETSKFYKDYHFEELLPNKIIKGNGTKFNIYCQLPVSKSVIYIWRHSYLVFHRLPHSYELFEGANQTDVFNKRLSKTILNPISWFSWRGDNVVEFPAFNEYCIGISTSADENFTLQLIVRTVNYWKVLQMVIGITMFISAPTLSKNSFFHYTSGISIGVLASVLILLFMFSKVFPKKTASYAILVFGYSFVFYLIQQFYYELPKLFNDYMDIVLGYMFFMAFLSFVVCYRMGPVSNIRTINLIQWTMQIIGSILIFLSTEYREISTALIIVIISVYFAPLSLTSKIKSLWSRYFPPKVKLLSEVEYIEQGTRETKRALDDLRKYCNSPECKAWSTILKLKTPSRFASFVEGDSHISDAELLAYDSECNEDGFDSMLPSEDSTEDELFINNRSNHHS